MSALATLRHVREMSPADIETFLGRDHVIRRAERYAEEGRVDALWVDEHGLRAHVIGGADTPYHCVLRLWEGELEAECSCPYNRGVCWHVGAVLFVLQDDPELATRLEEKALALARGKDRPTGDAAPAPEGEVGDPAAPTTGEDTTPAAREELREELQAMLLAWPRALVVDLLAEAAATHRPVEMLVRERRPGPSALDLRILSQAARAALRPGVRPTRWEVPRMAADLREIVRSTTRLVGGAEPEAALDLVLEIAARAWHRLEEVDDRDGALLRLVRDSLREWCRGWQDVPGRDRPAIARELFAWIIDDPAGAVTDGLVLDAAETLGNAGLEALEKLLRPALEERLGHRVPGTPDDDTLPADPVASRLRGALREVAEVRGDLDAFLAACDHGGRDGASIVAAVRRLRHEGRFDEALAWAERGRRRARGTARAALEDLRVGLLQATGRRREAVEAAWELFLAEPGTGSFRRLLETVPEGERAEWRRRALDAAESTADATAFVEVALAAGDLERIAHRLDSTPNFVLAASPRSLEQAAGALDRRHGWAAARLRLHLAGRLLADGDPRHYGRVRSWLEEARAVLFREDRAAEWREAIDRLRRAHRVVRAWFEDEEDA